MKAYHFTNGNKLRNGEPLPKKGEWLVYDGPVRMCESGLHASKHPRDALRYAPGTTLHLVEVEDVVEEQDDKLVARRRKIVKTIDAEKLLRDFARWCALRVIKNWKDPVPDVVMKWLKTGDELYREAARSAAYSAARAAAFSAFSAACAAAYSAADSAADSAYSADSAADSAASSAYSTYSADSAQRRELAAMVDRAFKEID